jgi:hypothetical protein
MVRQKQLTVIHAGNSPISSSLVHRRACAFSPLPPTATQALRDFDTVA